MHPLALTLQAALSAREAALVEAERLRGEHGMLLHKLVQLKATEAQRMDDINRMHGELVSMWCIYGMWLWNSQGTDCSAAPGGIA